MNQKESNQTFGILDEKLQLLVNTIKNWTQKYAYKIYVKGKDEEKRENYYDVVFFHQKPNESIPSCTVNVYITITELEQISFDEIESGSSEDEKYFLSFRFENENLTRTLDMNLHFEKWIDKLIKDKEKLRNHMDLSSEYMKTRFVKPLKEEKVEEILNRIKKERQEKRNKQKTLKEKEEKKKNIKKTDSENIQKNELHEEKDKKLDNESQKENSIAEITKEDSEIQKNQKDIDKNKECIGDSEKLHIVLTFLKNILHAHFISTDIRRKGKIRWQYYTEILKMVNYKLCISYKYLEESKSKSNETKEIDDLCTDSPIYQEFSFDESDTTDSSESGSTDETEDDENSEEERTHKELLQKSKTLKDEKGSIANLFNINNKDFDLIKDLSIYKNNNFYGHNIFFECTKMPKPKGDFFLFDKDNIYYKYVFTDNYYDFLWFVAYADEDEEGHIHYNACINDLCTYLYELKKNREKYYTIWSLEDLSMYKQLMYICYDNELQFILTCLGNEFKKFDLNESGYIHRSKFKRILHKNDHILSRQEYKLLLHVFEYNDDQYVYYKDIGETIMRLRFEGIKNSIFERDSKLLLRYLCEELLKHNIKNKKKIHVFDCKHVLDYCDKIYLHKNIIHIILSSLDFDDQLETDIRFFLQVAITIIINSIRLEKMQTICQVLSKEKDKGQEKSDKSQNMESATMYRCKKGTNILEKVNVPALELVERTLTKLLKVLDEKNESYLNTNDFIETILESNKKKKIIDIKEICKFNKSELQGFVVEIDTYSDTRGDAKNMKHEKAGKNRSNLNFNKNVRIHYESHIHKWCSKTYQIRSCYYYSYFLNYPETLLPLDEEIICSLLFAEEKKE